LGSTFADKVAGNRDVREMSGAQLQGGCFMTIVISALLWLLVCFPLMRLVLWLVCDVPFKWN
jgi:hypothetical protein